MLDLSFAQSRPFITVNSRRVVIVQIGAGGTGSWLYPHLCRFLRVMLDRGDEAELILFDPDTVEEANLVRQNFCPAELGVNKAHALAFRYQAAWGLHLPAVDRIFSVKALPHPPRHLRHVLFVLVGCVDNASARSDMHELLIAQIDMEVPNVIWVDAGNHVESGQVLVGNVADPYCLATAFETPGAAFCRYLPSPALQCPELLVPNPEERPDHNLGCEELARLKAQSLTVNLAMASLMADTLLHLLITRDLRRFASYLDIASGARRNRYNTPENLAAAIGLDSGTLFDRGAPASAR